MKKAISAVISIVMIGIMVNTQIIQAFAVNQSQLREIQISNTGTGIQIKADVTGNKTGYKYKFVWVERSRLGGNWGTQNVNWGVIREFELSDTVTWKPPRMPQDYEIYMDVMDQKRDIKTIHRPFLGLSSLKRVTRDQIKGIDISLEGDLLRIKANIVGDKRWFKYKFVWLEANRFGGNWGTQNVNWGVIREFELSDTIVWKPPRMPADYVIYMDVMDAYGSHIDGFNRYFEGEIIKARQNTELAEKRRKDLESKVSQARQRAEQQEKERKDLENQVSKAKQEFAEAEKRKKEIAAKIAEAKKNAEAIEKRRKELESKIAKAKQEAAQREKRKQELQNKIEVAKQNTEKKKTAQIEKQTKKEQAKEQVEKEKQRTKDLENEVRAVEKQVEELEKRQKLSREKSSKESETKEKAVSEETRKDKIIWDSKDHPGNTIEGGYYSQLDGHWINDKNFETSCFIPVEEEKSYSATGADCFVTWWDADKKLIGYTTKENFVQSGYVTASKGSKYARFTFCVKAETKKVIEIAEQKSAVAYTILGEDEKKKNIEIAKTLVTDSTVNADDLGKVNPEFSKYIKYIKEITGETSNNDCSIGKEILNSRDTSLETISKKLMYVCHRLKEDKSVKNVNAYPVQILATMKLVESVLRPEPGTKGSVGDIKTGEGKSLVVTLTAIILQSYGKKIDIVTPNMELATRDWKDSKEYYDLFGMTSGFLYDKTRDSEFKDAANEPVEWKDNYKAEYNFEVLNKGIMYTTGSNLQWMYLKSAFSAKELRNREYDVCIVDEADNLLIDGASSPALISSNFPTKEAEEILVRVYKSVLEGKDASEIKGILQKEFRESNVSDEELSIMIKAVKKSQEAEKGKDYVLEKDEFWGNQVQIIDSNTGFKLSSSRWHAYVHEMIEIKEDICLQPTSVTKCAVSPMIFFGAYKNLLGVTGTTGNEKEEELFKNIYKLSTFKVPTHREVKRGVAIKVYDPQKEDLDDLITKETLEESKKGRPVLVILGSINATNEMKGKYLRDANLIQGINVQEDRRSIRNAGQSGRITVSTIAAGRGTDIKLDEGAVKAGGLHVIVSKLPAQSRTLVQNIGRSSRQGQPGSATIYVRPGDRFGDISKINSNTVNLFRLQKRFSEYIRKYWPWMIAKEDIYTSESEYRFGADYDEILRMDAKIIVDKFFWPKKVLTRAEYQECLDLTKNMVLTAWGSMYTHLATSEKGSDMKYCNQKYEELLRALNKWIPEECPGPEEYISRWAKELGKDKEIFEFLYKREKSQTIRDFLTELFKNKRVQIHAMNAGHNINSFENMLKFMPIEHQEAYKALMNAEAAYRESLVKYNRDVAAYNQREAERARVAKGNSYVYNKLRELEISSNEQTKSQVIQSPPEEEPDDQNSEDQIVNEKPHTENSGGGLLDIFCMKAYAYDEAEESQPPQEPQKGFLNVVGEKLGGVVDAVLDKISLKVYAPSPEDFETCDNVNKFDEESAKAQELEHQQLTDEEIQSKTEEYRRQLRQVPNRLAPPVFPIEPDWKVIGWEFLRGRSIDDMIWARWFSPRAKDYAGILHPCSRFADLGAVDDTELYRLDENIRKISYQMEREEKAKEQREQAVRVALRGTSGGMKILGGIGIAVGSVAAIAAVVGTDGAVLPLVVAAMGTAGTMFGISDTIEGANDVVSATTKQSLDQKSYNPLRDTVFGGNELVYAVSEMGISLTTSALASKAVANNIAGLFTPKIDATLVDSQRLYGIDLENINFSRTVQGHIGRPYQESKLTIAEIIRSNPPIEDPRGTRALSWTVDGIFNGSTGVYELIIDPITNTVWHFVFKSK